MSACANAFSFLLGWLLLRPQHLPWLSADIPQPLLSASSCLCGVKPDHEDWLDAGKLEFLRLDEGNSQGSFHFLGSIRNARYMNTRWFGSAFRPVALALRPPAAARFDALLKEDMTASNKGNPAYRYAPLKALPFTGQERLLGFEVLSYNWGWHSYLCNGLEVELMRDFGGTLNAHGLISDGDIAGRFAEACNERFLGEPGLNLACALYDLA